MGGSPPGAERWRGRRQFARAALLPLAITLVFATLTLLRPAIIDDYIENLLVDYRFKMRNLALPRGALDQVVVVAIDERSLAARGRWPWTRTLVAELIERIHAGGPRALAVDLFFAEPESPAADDRLAAALAAGRDKTVAALVFEVRAGGSFTGEIPDVLFDQAIARVEKPGLLRPLEATGVLLPPEPIAPASVFGHVNYLPDRNGKLRVEYLYLRYGGEYFASLSLQAARLYLGLGADKVAVDGVFGVDLGERIVPTDIHGGLYINYYGGTRSFRHISAADVLSGRVPPGALRDKLVVLGTTAVATYDTIVTPFAANVAGVEKNATVAANIITNDFLHDAPRLLDALIVLLIGPAVFLLCRRRGAASAFLGIFLFTLLLLAGNLAMFDKGLRLNLAYPLGAVIAVGMAVISARFLGEERKAREYRRMFSSYVSERVVNELIADPTKARLGGDRREVTVLFSDIRGFTTFSERHAPEEVVAVLNEYLGAMTDIVFRWEGTLDKFIGDAVMVFWGAPLPQPDQAERALRCALHMCDGLDALNAKWASEGKDALAIGIGINSGEAVVGNIGALGKKTEYTVIGDHVNLASRLESLTKKYHARILISEHTLERVRPVLERNGFGHVAVRGLEQVAVKGKDQPVAIYEFAASATGMETTVDARPGGAVVRMDEK
ncbi:MAG: CHASE2 domain-containing protein [Candidatus Methylomirabilia bacterium]